MLYFENKYFNLCLDIRNVFSLFLKAIEYEGFS